MTATRKQNSFRAHVFNEAHPHTSPEMTIVQKTGLRLHVMSTYLCGPSLSARSRSLIAWFRRPDGLLCVIALSARVLGLYPSTDLEVYEE